MAVSVSTLISNILGHLHTDSIANAVFWTECQLITFCDQAVKRLARTAGMFVTRSTSTTVSTSTATYALPSRHLSTIRVTLNGAALVPSSTTELSFLTATPDTTTGTPLRWYQDKSTLDRIGLQPVPALAVNGQTLAIIYHDYPAELDCPKVNTSIPVPTVVGDYLEVCMLREAYRAESDGALPEVADHLDQVIQMWDRMFVQYWGDVQ